MGLWKPCPDVREKSKQLGCSHPNDKAVAIVPRNLESASKYEELEHANGASVLRNLLKEAKVYESRFEKDDQNFPEAEERFGVLEFLLFAGDKFVLPIITMVIAGYVVNYGKQAALVRVKLTRINQDTGVYECLEFEGTPEQIDQWRASITDGNDQGK